MSIRAIALDLYRAQQKVAQLEKDLESAPSGEKDAVALNLQYAKNEYGSIRKMLDGEKETSAFRKRFATFGSFN